MAMRLFCILIVEAEKKYQEILHKSLQKKDRLILTAFSSNEAISITSQESVDMIILDYATSKQDGIDFMRIKFNHETPNIPVFMMSCDVTLQTKLLSYISGAIRFFPKPVDLEELLKWIDKLEITNMKGGLDLIIEKTSEQYIRSLSRSVLSDAFSENAEKEVRLPCSLCNK